MHSTSDEFLSNRTTGISEKRINDLYNNTLGGKQAARLDDLVNILHENVNGMQRMFTATIVKEVPWTKNEENQLRKCVIKEGRKNRHKKGKEVFSFFFFDKNNRLTIFPC